MKNDLDQISQAIEMKVNETTWRIIGYRTSDATRDVTRNATSDATWSITRREISDATWDVTGDATKEFAYEE